MIQIIVQRVWDPIGVRGIAEAGDEHDMYAPQMLKLLETDAPTEEIATYLKKAQTESSKVPKNARPFFTTRGLITAFVVCPATLRLQLDQLTTSRPVATFSSILIKTRRIGRAWNSLMLPAIVVRGTFTTQPNLPEVGRPPAATAIDRFRIDTMFNAAHLGGRVGSVLQCAQRLGPGLVRTRCAGLAYDLDVVRATPAMRLT